MIRILTAILTLSFHASICGSASELDASDSAFNRFVGATPPYTTATANDAYHALLEVSRLRGFKRLGYAMAGGKQWQDKILEVMKDGSADSALIKVGYEDISIFQLVGLGRDWSRGDYQTSEANKKIEAEYQRLSKEMKKANKAEMATPNQPSD